MKLLNWRAEYTITLLIIFAVILLLIPTSLQSTVQANFIAKWKDCYDRLEYAQDVILKQEKQEILTSFRRAKTPEERETLFREILKPYFRLNNSKAPHRYHPKFMNGEKVPVNNKYNFTDYYFSDKKLLVGIKDIPNSEGEESTFIMMFDVNGLLPPNKWGKDIFGATVYADRIEPLGKNLELPQLREDCSENGSGVGCSYYYKIGGSFED